MEKESNPTAIESLTEQDLSEMNPQIADAIRAVQAELDGQKELEWTEFSSHTQS